MQSLTALILAASILSNVNSFRENPVEYQENLYSQINLNIASLIQSQEPGEEIDEYGIEEDIAAELELDGEVLGEQASRGQLIQTSVTVTDEEEDVADVSPTPSTEPSPTITPIPTDIQESPTPTPTRVVFDNSNVAEKILHASNEFGVDVHFMNNLADCESNYNPNAHNERYDYGGLYQFSVGTWISTRARMGVNTNPELRFSAQEAARTAAFKISQDGTGAWSGCL